MALDRRAAGYVPPIPPPALAALRSSTEARPDFANHPTASGRLCAAVVALPPEHFSLVFVFVEMFACTAMAEGPLRLRRDRYSEYRLAATCRQALDKCALVAPDKNGVGVPLRGQRENGVVPPLLGTPPSVAPSNHHFVGKLSPRGSDRISRVTLLSGPPNWAAA